MFEEVRCFRYGVHWHRQMYVFFCFNQNDLITIHMIHHVFLLYIHTITGWWFGTLVFFSIYWEFHHPN